MLGIQRRGIEVAALCLVCKRLDEDGAHLFIKCKEVRKVWSGRQMEHDRQLLTKCAAPKEFVQLLLSWDTQKVMMSIYSAVMDLVANAQQSKCSTKESEQN